MNFSRLSLRVPELDNLSRAMLLANANGLALPLKKVVLQQHPAALVDSISAARNAEQLGLILV